MTLARLLSPSLRSGLMVAAGAVLITLPSVLELGSAALVTGIAVGTIAVALGLAGTADDGRGTIPLSVQAAYDRGLALGLLLVAILFGIAGQRSSLAFFGATGLAALLVTAVTRYSARRI